MECQKCKSRTQLYLCNQCQVWLRYQLLGMPTLLGYLEDAAIGNTRLSNEQSHQLGFESRTPVFSDRASLLIADINSTVGQWAKSMAIVHGYVVSPPVTWHRPWEQYQHTTRDYATFLAAHVDTLANDEDVGELCDALRSYVKRGLTVINRRPEDQFCGPCPAPVSDHRRCVDSDGKPTCQKQVHTCATALMAPPGALEVTCPSCGAVHGVERLVTRLLANADNYRGTISELYRVLRMLNESVPMSTLYRWAEPPTSKRRGSGQLRPVGYVRDDNGRIGVTRHSDKDKPLYRVSDARKRREENRKVKGDKVK